MDPDSWCDLVIRGGTVATAGSSAGCDLGITDGKISQIGGDLRGRRELDASGAFVLPGGIDMHVHLSTSEPAPENQHQNDFQEKRFAPGPAEPAVPDWVDDFASGSAAAIAGGVTTFGNMTLPASGGSLASALARDLELARTAAVDYVLHPVLIDPTTEALAELPQLAAAGHTSLKLFMTNAMFERHSDAMIEAVQLAGRHGMLTLIHCEDGALIRFANKQLLAEGRGSLADWAASRPVAAEQAAIERAVAICELTG